MQFALNLLIYAAVKLYFNIFYAVSHEKLFCIFDLLRVENRKQLKNNIWEKSDESLMYCLTAFSSSFLFFLRETKNFATKCVIFVIFVEFP